MSDQINVNAPANDLAPRVNALEKGMDNLSNSITRQGDAFAAALSRQGEVMFQKFDTLGSKMDQRSQTPWGVIGTFAGVLISFVVAVGTLAFVPINNGISDAKLLAREVAAETRTQINDLVKDTRAQVVPRSEHADRWRQNERETERMEKRIERIESAIGHKR